VDQDHKHKGVTQHVDVCKECKNCPNRGKYIDGMSCPRKGGRWRAGSWSNEMKRSIRMVNINAQRMQVYM
jgi:hypothetical protein